jgi:hypothetical protein
MIWNLKQLIAHCEAVLTRQTGDGPWIPARPWVPSLLWRCRAAWLVLRGKADAVVWPGGQ